jgi:hypothetical protein
VYCLLICVESESLRSSLKYCWVHYTLLVKIMFVNYSKHEALAMIEDYWLMGVLFLRFSYRKGFLYLTAQTSPPEGTSPRHILKFVCLFAAAWTRLFIQFQRLQDLFWRVQILHLFVTTPLFTPLRIVLRIHIRAMHFERYMVGLNDTVYRAIRGNSFWALRLYFDTLNMSFLRNILFVTCLAMVTKAHLGFNCFFYDLFTRMIFLIDRYWRLLKSVWWLGVSKGNLTVFFYWYLP